MIELNEEVTELIVISLEKEVAMLIVDGNVTFIIAFYGMTLLGVIENV